MKNIKHFTLAAAACCLSVFANAQVTYGPVAGLNMASLVGTTQDLKMKPGFHAGLVVDWSVSEHLAFETGLAYTQKGTKFKDPDALKFNLSYIEIPFMPKYKAASGFNFFMGPYLGILLSSKATDGTNEIDQMEYTRKFEGGFKMGVGYQMSSGLAFSAHYGLGLTRLDKEDSGEDVSNSVIGISVAYMLGGK